MLSYHLWFSFYHNCQVRCNRHGNIFTRLIDITKIQNVIWKCKIFCKMYYSNLPACIYIDGKWIALNIRSKMIHKPPTNKISVLWGLCRREMRQNKKKKSSAKIRQRSTKNPFIFMKKKKSRFDKWSSSQLSKTFCWIATWTPT